MRNWLARLACWRHGHEPGDRDWVGMPMECVRCGLYDAQMNRAAWERFCGKAAIRDWHRETAERMAWDEMTAAMVGDWPGDPLERELRLMMGDDAYREFASRIQDMDPWTAVVARRSF